MGGVGEHHHKNTENQKHRQLTNVDNSSSNINYDNNNNNVISAKISPNTTSTFSSPNNQVLPLNNNSNPIIKNNIIKATDKAPPNVDAIPFSTSPASLHQKNKPATLGCLSPSGAVGLPVSSPSSVSSSLHILTPSPTNLPFSAFSRSEDLSVNQMMNQNSTQNNVLPQLIPRDLTLKPPTDVSSIVASLSLRTHDEEETAERREYGGSPPQSPPVLNAVVTAGRFFNDEKKAEKDEISPLMLINEASSSSLLTDVDEEDEEGLPLFDFMDSIIDTLPPMMFDFEDEDVVD
eukprot:GDKK01036018.1.p1 GENE.GDKK01036018.1~~GDKK01036018.1.p1  ORF type:complete len:291 (+),score=93.32 GDKK01036018.1:1-873(+)